MKKSLKIFLKKGKFENVAARTVKNMSLIKGKNNKSTEVKFRMLLVRSKFLGWKMHDNEIFGKPDFYFPDFKVAIFLDGCYWHGCKKCGHIPKTRSEFWKAKININKNRDKSVNYYLSNAGVKIIRIWEHQLKSKLSSNKVLKLINEVTLKK